VLTEVVVIKDSVQAGHAESVRRLASIKRQNLLLNLPRLSPPPTSFGGFRPRPQGLGLFFCQTQMHARSKLRRYASSRTRMWLICQLVVSCQLNSLQAHLCCSLPWSKRCVDAKLHFCRGPIACLGSWPRNKISLKPLNSHPCIKK
jgi:hypothetical protein